MPPVFKRAISWLGLVDDEIEDEVGKPDEGFKAARAVEPAGPTGPAGAAGPTAPPSSPVQTPPAGPNFSGDNSQTVLLSPSLLVTPVGYHAVRPIADRYQAGLPTVMDLRSMPIDEAKRCVDFFSGMIYALDGAINRIAKGVFLLTPAGTNVDQASLDALLMELR